MYPMYHVQYLWALTGWSWSQACTDRSHRLGLLGPFCLCLDVNAIVSKRAPFLSQATLQTLLPLLSSLGRRGRIMIANSRESDMGMGSLVHDTSSLRIEMRADGDTILENLKESITEENRLDQDVTKM